LPLAAEGRTRVSLTNWHSPRFEPLAADAEAAEALARAALQTRRLSLSFVELSSNTMSTFASAAEEAGFIVGLRDAEASPEVEIGGTWEEYLPTISKNMRREFKRRHKRLNEAGEFRFEVYDGSADLEATVDEAFAVEAASWKGSTGTAVALDRGTLDFYLRIAAWAAPRDWLRICLMRLDGAAIASDFALEVDGIFYSLKGGYDPAYAEYSPGRLMDGLEIQRAHELGLRRFEFGGDPEHHKLQWRPALRQLTNLEAFAPTLAGRADRLVRVQGRGAAKALRRQTRALLRR
ncbi:MAG: GNAT family N-acetyltransferase, partial [Gaiellaceae bacterium]